MPEISTMPLFSRTDISTDHDRPFNLIENYIYLHHIDKFILLPTYPESVSDSLSATFASTSILSRSAPIFAYSYSGPRTIQVKLSLHREMMSMINYKNSNVDLELDDDYVDTLIKLLHTAAVPRYNALDNSNVKMVNPPQVSLRFGNDIYIKGVVNGGLTVDYSGPILEDNKYAMVDIGFQISEIDPYDADTVAKMGSFRGLNMTLERNLYKS